MIYRLTNVDLSGAKAVFFDLDGTITESGEGCMRGIRYMFDKIGHPEPDEQRVRAFLGPPVKKHLMEHYGFCEEDALAAYAHYRAYYESTGLWENRLYDGIAQALHDIRDCGKTLYIATSKPEHLAEKILEHFEILGLFAAVFGARHDLDVYDKNEVLQRAVAMLGGAPEGVMIGDRFHDVAGGRLVGLHTIGALYGYGSYKELADAGCDCLVDTPQDLSALLGRKGT